VALVTTHLGLKEVSPKITGAAIKQTVMQTVDGLTHFWGIKKPKIAVCALNPHAGDSGLFGREEIDVIEPCLKSIRALRKDFVLDGPFPADTLFAKHMLTKGQSRWDAIICMYHDQGLIPIKLIDFFGTVNVTLGLPMIRTSVDHGVGFDIAGKGIANPSSLCAAINLAAEFVRKSRT
jgi:4-hydroxy-L-threonine phosphate dehydrogenase PdxA